MHSDDFDRITIALGKAGVIDPAKAHRAAIAYRVSRQEIELEAEERASKLYDDKPFEKLLLIRDPLVGMPLMLWAVLAFLVISAIAK